MTPSDVARRAATGLVVLGRDGEQQLGMLTVTEHVDRPEMVERLRELGVDDGQGYHLGRPRPLSCLPGAPS